MPEILLSVCIPTFNRAKYLENTINSIVNQKKFIDTNHVEIVISDNCSDDNTEEIVQKYIRNYGEKIRYYKNPENIKDANFEKVLSLGKGLFLKLNNDTLMHQQNTLELMIDRIQHNKERKDILFFSNGTLKNILQYHCKDLNSFVQTASFYSTWILCFGIWKEDFKLIDGFSRYANLQLVQTDVLLRLISCSRPVLIDNSKIFNSISPSSKGGYNIYQVFITNYLGLLEKYRMKNQISWITLFNEKSKLMIHFLIPWSLLMYKNKLQYSFDTKGAVSIVFKKYGAHPILYIGFIYCGIKLLKNYMTKKISLF